MIHNQRAFAAASQAYGGDATDRVRRFTPLVRRLAWHFAGSVEEFMEPEDLIQVGMIALVECSQRHDREGEDGFAAYAKLRVRGAMVDSIRAQRKGMRKRKGAGGDGVQIRFEVLDEAAIESDPAFASAEPDALTQILEQEDRDVLAKALTQLPERLSLVLQLYFVEELNLSEIAQIIDVSVPRVHQLKASALDKLRAILTELTD